MVTLRATISRCASISSLNRPYGTENQASQVGERFRSTMNRIGPVVIGLIFLMFAAPLSSMVTYQALELSEQNIQHAEGWDKDIDVPTWRIGDEWVYETKFDVAQLIAQANVSASLNTLTGDTTYTVEDILFVTLDGTQTLVYKLVLDGDFTSGNNGATLEGNETAWLEALASAKGAFESSIEILEQRMAVVGKRMKEPHEGSDYVLEKAQVAFTAAELDIGMARKALAEENAPGLERALARAEAALIEADPSTGLLTSEYNASAPTGLALRADDSPPAVALSELEIVDLTSPSDEEE